MPDYSCNLIEASKNIRDNKKKFLKYWILCQYFLNKSLNINKLILDYKSKYIREKIVFLDFPEHKKENYLLKKKMTYLNNFMTTNNFILNNCSMDKFKKDLKIKINNYKNNNGIYINSANLNNHYELVRTIDKHKKNYSNIEYFKNMEKNINNIDSTEKTCPICLEKIKKNKMLITDCCHIFCIDCFFSFKCDKCPECRHNLNINNINHIIEENEQTNIFKYYNINYLTKFIGTKLTFIIKYIYENSIDSNILFLAKNDDILETVSKVLNKFNLCNTIFKSEKNNSPILLINYNSLKNLDIPFNQSVVIFNDLIENKQKELDILNKISLNNFFQITDIIKFIIRGTKEENYNLF